MAHGSLPGGWLAMSVAGCDPVAWAAAVLVSGAASSWFGPSRVQFWGTDEAAACAGAGGSGRLWGHGWSSRNT
jgi:hypothetical protein